MYFGIVIVILLPVFFIGKRGFCQYFCPWGVLNISVTKLKNFLRIPSLGLKADSSKCLNCGTCDANCPMSLDVSKSVASGSMDNTECILCGSCADNCKGGAIKYTFRIPERVKK
jgi:polyferredoxin